MLWVWVKLSSDEIHLIVFWIPGQIYVWYFRYLKIFGPNLRMAFLLPILIGPSLQPLVNNKHLTRYEWSQLSTFFANFDFMLRSSSVFQLINRIISVRSLLSDDDCFITQANWTGSLDVVISQIVIKYLNRWSSVIISLLTGCLRLMT